MRKQDRSTQSQNNIRKSQRQIRREAKQYEKKQRWKRGREIYIAGYLMVALFLGMLAYFFYFEGYGKNAILVNSKNNRTQNMVQSMRKGSIVTSDGVEVALTQILEDGTQYREYPFRNIYAHTVGYVPKGGAGLESTQKIRLLMSHDVFLEQLRQEYPALQDPAGSNPEAIVEGVAEMKRLLKYNDNTIADKLGFGRTTLWRMQKKSGAAKAKKEE